MKTNKEVQFQVISTIEFMQKQLGVEVTEDNLLDLIENQLGSYGLEYDDEDVMTIQRGLESRLLIKHTTGISIDNDSEIRDWYSNYDADSEYFWPRYKNYLTRDMKLDPKSIDILENKTLVDLMNYVADPRKDSSEKALRRGLVIGDVQSGKTSTYTGLICKAADAGYNVVILLTGVTETLRKQTQERIEEGVIGRSVKIEKIGGKTQRIIKPVGVGKDNEPSKALSLTSIENDFKTDKTDIILSLKDMNLLVLVIKKNVTVLQRVLDWLKGNNLDPVDNKIHCPMLLIDDEADNASINTKKDLYNPTKTNALIRSLCEIFERTTYIGFTATPFANVFIYPDTEEQMANADLFPEDFIYVLPTPSTYIGAKDIYGNGRYSYWLNMTDDIIEPSFETLDEEFKRGIDKDTRLLYYKHAKTWRGILPNSINDAVCTFILSNAVRILRNDEEQPTTMLINVSRFVDVQNYVKEEIEILLQQIKRFIKFDLSDKLADNERSKVYQALKRNWEEQYSYLDYEWSDICNRDIMFRASDKIETRVVNGSKMSQKIDYEENPSASIIAVGGIALSRGLTLKGLCVSYFYRNTNTFDVLMQMGRWFGYRYNYDDLCKIWTSKETCGFYEEISDSTEELKGDLRIMHRIHKTPREFGIRVRNESRELQITAANKMRHSFDHEEIVNIYGNLFETPYVDADLAHQKSNLDNINSFIVKLNNSGYSFDLGFNKEKGARVIKNVPSGFIADLIAEAYIAPHKKFDKLQMYKHVTESFGNSLWDVLFVSGDSSNTISLSGDVLPLHVVKRDYSLKDDKVLNIGNRSKLSGTAEGAKVFAKGDDIRRLVKQRYDNEHSEEDRTKELPAIAWFQYLYMDERNPLLSIFIIDLEYQEQSSTNRKKDNGDYKNTYDHKLVVGYSLGFPNTHDDSERKNKHYTMNYVGYRKQLEASIEDSEEEIEDNE